MAAKRKRNDLDLNAKIEIFKLLDAKESRKNISEKYGVDVSTISKLLKNREKIEEQFQSSTVPTSSKRLRLSPYDSLEQGLLKWFKQTRASLLPVSGPLLAEIAERLAKEMGITDWNCSNGFLERFKKRHGITFKAAAGESAAVDSDIVDDWLTRLPQILDGYSPDDIFNMDETGIFFKLLPDRTLCFKNEDCHGGKKSKDRLNCCSLCKHVRQ